MSAPTPWKSGYFCAVAVLLRLEGGANATVRDLFRAGGDWRKAEPEDIELFREHGLLDEEVQS